MSLMRDIGVQSPLAMLAITRWGELKTERARHEADWQLIAQLFRPLRKGMGMDDPANALRAIRPLSSDQIKVLGSTQVAALTTEQVAAIATNDIVAMNTTARPMAQA